jgi:hypothetical protein
MKCCIPPERVAILATQIAIEIAKGKDIDEINLYKSVASQISSVLQVIISQRFVNKKNDCPKSEC